VQSVSVKAEQSKQTLFETLLKSVSSDVHPLMVGQSHDSFTLHAECLGCDVIPASSAEMQQIVSQDLSPEL
jgi:hypothetical protein